MKGASVRAPAIINSNPATSARAVPAEGHISFKEVLAGVNSAMQESSDIFGSIRQFQSTVMSGRKISPKELLVFQIRASQFGVHVELLSKVAESGLSSLRRLQQTQ